MTDAGGETRRGGADGRSSEMADVERPADADAQRCGDCGGVYRFDTSVPSVLWNRVVRPLGGSEYLCTACIVGAFARAGVSFTASLWGQEFNGLPITVEIGGATATAARELDDENTRLRAALRQAHACATLRDDGTCDGCPVSDVLTAVTEPQARPTHEPEEV